MGGARDHAAQLAEQISLLWKEKKLPAEAVAAALRIALHDPNLGLPLVIQMANAFEPSTDHGFRIQRQLNSLIFHSVPKQRDIALNNWGNALSNHAKTKAGEDSGKCRADARQKLEIAEQLEPGYSAYNFACLEALEGNAKEAVRWLKKHISSGAHLGRKNLAEESDFDAIRTTAVFRAFVDSLAED